MTSSWSVPIVIRSNLTAFMLLLAWAWFPFSRVWGLGFHLWVSCHWLFPFLWSIPWLWSSFLRFFFNLPQICGWFCVHYFVSRAYLVYTSTVVTSRALLPGKVLPDYWDIDCSCVGVVRFRTCLPSIVQCPFLRFRWLFLGELFVVWWRFWVLLRWWKISGLVLFLLCLFPHCEGSWYSEFYLLLCLCPFLLSFFLWLVVSFFCRCGICCQFRCIFPGFRRLELVCSCSWASYQIRKIAGCACAGNALNVFPATDFKGNRYLSIPACIRACASRTCRDVCRDRSPAVPGGENVPGIPGACATRNFTYLLWHNLCCFVCYVQSILLHLPSVEDNFVSRVC